MFDLDWRDMPSLSALRAFDATARHASFAGAARALNVTHAAIAQQVRGLEAFLGASLVERRGRTVGLTEQGEHLARALAEGFGAISSGIEGVREREEARALRITTTSAFADKVILPRLRGFWEKHPGIELSFTPTDRRVDFIAEGFDLAIRVGAPTDARLSGRLLTESEWVAFGTPELVDDPDKDITAQQWIFNDVGPWEAELFAKAGLDLNALQTMRVDSIATETVAVRGGLALSFSSEVLIRDELAAGTFKRVSVRADLGQLTYYMVTRAGQTRPALTAFMDWLAGEVSPSIPETSR